MASRYMEMEEHIKSHFATLTKPVPNYWSIVSYVGRKNLKTEETSVVCSHSQIEF